MQELTERRAVASPTAADIAAINARLDAGDGRMGNIEASLAENTAATKRIYINTRDMIDLFQSFAGAMKVLNVIGKLAKPIGYIAAAGAAVMGFWNSIKTGVWTK